MFAEDYTVTREGMTNQPQFKLAFGRFDPIVLKWLDDLVLILANPSQLLGVTQGACCTVP